MNDDLHPVGDHDNLFITPFYDTFLQKMKRWAKEIRSRKQPALIIYASVTGTSAKYASDLGSIVSTLMSTEFIEYCSVYLFLTYHCLGIYMPILD